MKTDPTIKEDLEILKNGLTLKLIDIEEKFDKRFEEIDEKNKGYRDQILTGLDKVVKELESWREDKVLTDHKLDDHEERLIKLESPSH